MTYREASYWESRYRKGGRSGEGKADEWAFLSACVASAVREHDVRNVLDVGIGDGRLAKQMIAQMPLVEYTGVDISASGADLARKTVPKVPVIVADLVHAPLEPMDMVLCFNVHYHMATADRAARLVQNVLSSATKIAMILTWNERVLERGPLAEHCHYRPFENPPHSGFGIVAHQRLPKSLHKTLYTLVRVRDPG